MEPILNISPARPVNHAADPAPFPYSINPKLIPTQKIVDIRPGRHDQILYACPDSCWRDHHEGWRKAHQDGDPFAPMPMPLRHIFFENPSAHGCVPFGDNSIESRRQAIESSVRSDLAGWDRDLDEEARERVVAATVDAKLRGVETGMAPYFFCLGLRQAS